MVAPKIIMISDSTRKTEGGDSSSASGNQKKPKPTWKSFRPWRPASCSRRRRSHGLRLDDRVVVGDDHLALGDHHRRVLAMDQPMPAVSRTTAPMVTPR